MQLTSLPHQPRGDIAIYMALLIMSIMVSSAILFSSILVRQFQATEDAVASERAFYSANAGIEQGLYHLSTFTNPEPTTFNERIEYSTEHAFAGYAVLAQYAADGVTPCVQASGGYPLLENQSFPDDAPSAVVRRLEIDPGGCFP